METPVTFECKGQQIVGMLHLPDGRGRAPGALLLHGFTGTKTETHRMFVKLSRRLAAHGMASLRFDFRGSGDSAGDCEDLTIKSQIADALEAYRYFSRHKRINSRRIAVIGMSLGAAIAAHLAARESKKVKTLALWAPVAEGAGILDGLSTPEAVSSLAQTGVLDYGAHLVSMSFVRQFAEMKPVREIAKSKCPVLLVHGAKDETVSSAHSDMYERALNHGKRPLKKVIIPGADHCFNRHVWETRAIDETMDWLSETL